MTAVGSLCGVSTARHGKRTEMGAHGVAGPWGEASASWSCPPTASS